MATVVQRYVNAASSGGDGTTNATSGANAAWSSWKTAIDGLRAAYSNSLVGADVQVDLQVTGMCTDAQVTATLTTDATRYLRVYAATSGAHAGKYDADYNGFKYTDNSAWLNNIPAYTRIERLHFVITGASSSSKLWSQYLGAVDGILFDRCILERRTGTDGFAIELEATTNSATHTVLRNCLIVGPWGYMVRTQNVGSNCKLAMLNNTLYSTGTTAYGLRISNATGCTHYLKNNRIQLSTGVCYSVGGSGGTLTTAKNFTSDATSPDGGTYQSKTGTFTNAGSSDLSLAAGDAGIDLADDLSADSVSAFSIDMLGTTRSAPWDIGAFEYAIAVESNTALGTRSLDTVVNGTTNVTAYVYLENTDGTAATGLAYSTSGLTARSFRHDAGSVALTLANQTPTGAWTSGGFCEVNSTTAPGLYRFDVPNAAFAAGSSQVGLSIQKSGMRTWSAASWLVQRTAVFATVGSSPTRWQLTLSGPSVGLNQLLRRQLLVLNGNAAYERVTIVDCQASGAVVLSPPLVATPTAGDRVVVL